jgi:hypothetical protein
VPFELSGQFGFPSSIECTRRSKAFVFHKTDPSAAVRQRVWDKIIAIDRVYLIGDLGRSFHSHSFTFKRALVQSRGPSIERATGEEGRIERRHEQRTSERTVCDRAVAMSTRSIDRPVARAGAIGRGGEGDDQDRVGRHGVFMAGWVQV